MSTIVLAYRWNGYAPDSTLTVGTQVDSDTARSLIGAGEARWGSGGPPTLDPSYFIPITGLSGMTDAQIIAYNAALGGMVAQNPTGNAEAGYGESFDTSGSSEQTIATGGLSADVAGLSFAVLPTPRPVYGTAWAGLSGISGNASNQAAGIAINEVSNGVDTPVSIAGGNQQITGTGAVAPTISAVRVASFFARTRTFKLTVNIGGLLSVKINNGHFGLRSCMAFEQR